VRNCQLLRGQGQSSRSKLLYWKSSYHNSLALVWGIFTKFEVSSPSLAISLAWNVTFDKIAEERWQKFALCECFLVVLCWNHNHQLLFNCFLYIKVGLFIVHCWLWYTHKVWVFSCTLHTQYLNCWNALQTSTRDVSNGRGTWFTAGPLLVGQWGAGEYKRWSCSSDWADRSAEAADTEGEWWEECCSANYYEAGLFLFSDYLSDHCK